MRNTVMIIKKVIIITGLTLLVIAAKAPRIVPGPEKIPYVTEEMEQADFWLDRIANTKQTIITEQKYEQLYQQWVNEQLIIDISHFPEQITIFQLKQWLKEDAGFLKRAGRYYDGHRLVTPDFFNSVIDNVNLDPLVGSKKNVTWGMTVKSAALRLFPTKKIITVKPNDIEFNIIAHSGLGFAEPVVILHESKDGQWLFVASAIGRGWVEKEMVGVTADQTLVFDYMKQARLVLINKEEKLIYNNVEKSVRMGCWLQRNTKNKNEVFIPIRDKNGRLLIKKAKIGDINAWKDDFLFPTTENVIRQAFKLLNEPYGWGGQDGIGDCSELIHRLGRCFGMIWPRSTEGLKLGFKAKKIDFNKLVDGRTCLLLPGHVMLYLGKAGGRYYVIHNLYGIHALDERGPYIKRVARVLVSDLSLGQGSRKGSLKKRVNYYFEF